MKEGDIKAFPKRRGNVLGVIHLIDIDDEKHFLFSCSHLIEERKKLYDGINICCNNFSHLNPTDKLIWLMAVDNTDIHTRISNMVQKTNV